MTTRASSVWFSSLVALLVALGSQTFLDNIVPTSVADLQFGTPDPIIIHRAGGLRLWVAEGIIRLLSFAFGGFVSVVLSGELSRRLLALLLLVAVLATVFQQLPGSGSVTWLVLWSTIAPIGIILGAKAASATRSAA